MLLFTYGILQESATVVKKDCVIKGLMYDLGSFPVVTAVEPTVGYTIVGTLLEVTEENLVEFDLIEGVSSNMYRRQLIDTPQGEAWIYLYNGDVRGLAPISRWEAKPWITK